MGNYKKGKFKLYGRVAVVTGAARGIGKQISLAYASEGVNIALVDINQDNLNNVLNEIDNNFNDVKVIGLKCDIGNISEVNETISKVLEKFRKIDFLVNNAGITFRSKIENLNISD
ncbi:7-alpha-hydroxysteroid dehydrogenase [subsurface metagenome]